MGEDPLCKRKQRHQHAVAILNGQIQSKAFKCPQWNNSVSLSALYGLKWHEFYICCNYCHSVMFLGLNIMDVD